MNLIFVHGWGTTNTDTYGGLPEALVASAGAYNLDLTIQHINLGNYVSFHDEVTLDDIARALDQALRDLPGNEQGIQPFSCITHSTGGPVVRHWVNYHYGPKRLDQLPLRHLVMLAPANHGSTLAVLGKQRVGRLKAWFSGIEPGQTGPRLALPRQQGAVEAQPGLPRLRLRRRRVSIPLSWPARGSITSSTIFSTATWSSPVPTGWCGSPAPT